MNLKILLPFQIFAEKTGVLRIVAETREGSFGLLPHRLDCVAALAPGILIYETEARARCSWPWMKECWSRPAGTCSFRCGSAIGGTDLGQLREAVEREFLTLDEQEQSVRSVHGEIGNRISASLRDVST